MMLTTLAYYGHYYGLFPPVRFLFPLSSTARPAAAEDVPLAVAALPLPLGGGLDPVG